MFQKSLFPINRNETLDTNQKMRGGYYTPSVIADYLVNWGIGNQTKRILEPSCGDGNFIVAIEHYLQDRPHFQPTVVAVELDKQELEKAKNRVNGNFGPAVNWIEQDFFVAYHDLRQAEKFDLVIGNPPFIRFQSFNEDSQQQAFYHLKQLGYKPTRLANSWVAFVQLSIELLGNGGNLAMVVPAELLQVKYAQELRERLATQFEHIVIVAFKKLVFPEIQQEVVLLLAQGKRVYVTEPSDIHTLELRSGSELLPPLKLNESIAHSPAKHSRKGLKWTSLFLDNATFRALDEMRQYPNLPTLGDLATVDVGIVTGRNKFFLLSTNQKQEMGLGSLTVPIIGRTSALQTTRFTETDFQNYAATYPAYLLNLNKIAETTFSEPLKKYIAQGEQEKIHQGYKCRIRKRWFDVPSIAVPDAFLFRQIYRYPLLVVNESNVTSTDTIHRVNVKSGVNLPLLATLFFNSLTLAWAEVCGRSYGGGVLELEPMEAEELPIPYQRQAETVIDIEKVDFLLRQNDFLTALDYVDEVTLKNGLGFDWAMIRGVRQAWEQLRDRRIQRNHND